MPSTLAAARILVPAAAALLALGLASGASAQGGVVAAYNPYSSGWGNTGQPRNYPGTTPGGPPRGNAIVVPDATITSTPSPGMAFNPWRRNVQPPASITPYGSYSAPANEPTDLLPPPPPGPIRSRLLAVPQRGDGPRSPASIARAPAPPRANVTTVAVREPAAPPTVAAERPRAATTTTVVSRTPERAIPPPPAAPPPPNMAAPPPAPAPAPQVAVPPPPPPPVAPPQTIARATPPPSAAPAVPAAPPSGPIAGGGRVMFDGQSTELSPAARGELDRLASSITSRNTRQIELRAYAGGTSPEARKVSLARALAVRSYLIDRGVKSRIDVGAFLADGNSGPTERVDIVTPNG